MAIADVPAEIVRLRTEAMQMVMDGNATLEQLTAAFAAYEQLTRQIATIAMAGVVINPGDGKVQLESKRDSATQLIARGKSGLDHVTALQTAYQKVYEAVAEFKRQNVAVPDEWANLAPITQRFVFELTGDYRLHSVVEAGDLDEAKDKLLHGQVVEGEWIENHRYPNGKRWCGDGVDAYWKGVDTVQIGQPYVSRSYGSTLTVTVLGEVAPTAVPAAALKLFKFRLTGDEYEGSCCVRAANLTEAKAKVLASDVESGDRLDEAEFDAAEMQLFRQALGQLSETRTSVTGSGHTLSYRVIAS